MPGTVKAANKLNDRAIPPHQCMGRHLHIGYFGKVGVGMSIKTITKEVFNVWTAKLSGRQAYVMHDQQRDTGAIWPGTKVW